MLGYQKLAAFCAPVLLSACAHFPSREECVLIYQQITFGVIQEEMLGCDYDNDGSLDAIVITAGTNHSCPAGIINRYKSEPGCELSKEAWEKIQKGYDSTR
ncbi:hypothetical protein J4421_00535 [Candidatus Woesearchaeota archaeon]|nr:hypothetical protein [Candidatus Woesearchaeota archaeon]